MSVDYQAVAARDEALLDESGAEQPIDVKALAAKIQAALPSFESFADDNAELAGSSPNDDPGVELNWSHEAEEGYIQVYVHPRSVDVSHSFAGEDEMMDVLADLLDVLGAAGLHVWDPQNGDWL